MRRASGASGTERVGRGGRRESDLCIGEDDDEREKDGEEARKGVVGRRTAAGRQENASGTAEAVIASERHSHVKCPIRACTHRQLERTYSILANPCYIYSQFTALP